jgi:hypothetical protein
MILVIRANESAAICRLMLRVTHPLLKEANVSSINPNFPVQR